MAWAPLLTRVEEPVGLRFFADFEAGEIEYELRRDDDDYVAIPIDGLTPRRLNLTEAEFARLDLCAVLRQIQDGAGCKGVIERLANGIYDLGMRGMGGRSLALLVAPCGLGRLTSRDRTRLGARARGVDVRALLVPELQSTAASVRDELAELKVALTELPQAPPWAIDWSPLVLDDRFDVPLDDPVLFFGSRHPVIVDPQQRRIWLEGRDLKVKADGHSYRLFEHLAARPRVAVPATYLVNNILEAKPGDRLENKILSDVKHELMKAVRNCLTPAPASARIAAEGLILFEDGLAKLDVDPALVKVVRRLSEQ